MNWDPHHQLPWLSGLQTGVKFPGWLSWVFRLQWADRGTPQPSGEPWLIEPQTSTKMLLRSLLLYITPRNPHMHVHVKLIGFFLPAPSPEEEGVPGSRRHRASLLCGSLAAAAITAGFPSARRLVYLSDLTSSIIYTNAKFKPALRRS